MKKNKLFININKSPKKTNARTYLGKWRELYFENYNPLVIEIGCGRGNYVLALSELFPEKNFIGIDLDDQQVWEAAKLASEKNLQNTAFIHADAADLKSYFEQNEINEIWLTFPDTEHEKIHENSALTSPRFVENYKYILTKGGTVHLKTEDMDFFEYSSSNFNRTGFSLIKKIYDVYDINHTEPLLTIKTVHEQACLDSGKKVHYLSCNLLT